MVKNESDNKRRLQPAELRQRILHAGMSVFAEKGYRGATVRDIVELIGCSVNAVNNHFGTKEGLAVAVVEEMKRTIVMPVAHTAEGIGNDFSWRVAVKRFVTDVIGLFSSKDEPNSCFAALYRHESASLHDKKVTLHEEIVVPIFRQLESLVALGVEGRDPLMVRLATLALWNNVIAYALKHPEVIESDVPHGVDPTLFRQTTIDYMVEQSLARLRFKAA